MGIMRIEHTAPISTNMYLFSITNDGHLGSVFVGPGKMTALV